MSLFEYVTDWFMARSRDPMDEVLALLNPESLLYRQFLMMHKEMVNLSSSDDYDELAAISLQFVKAFQALPPKADASLIIQRFQEDCHETLAKDCLTDICNILYTLVKAVVIAAVITAAVVAIGFGVGWVLGAWVAAEAFLGQIIAGGVAANIVAGVGGGSFVASLALGVYGLFSDDLTEQVDAAVDAVAAVAAAPAA